MHIVVIRRQAQTKTRIRQHVFGVAAIAVVTGEARLFAKIFAPAATINTLAAGPAEPWHAQAFARFESSYILAKRCYRTDNFMPHCHRQLAACKFAVMDMQIGRSEERREGKECRSRWSPYH